MRTSIYSRIFENMDARTLRTRFDHVSDQPRDVVTRAPFIHVGSPMTSRNYRDRRNSIATSPVPKLNTHQFKLAPEVEVHPRVFSDFAVNLAHANLLHEKRMTVPSTVYNTALWARDSGLSNADVEPIKDLLRSNIPVAYRNEIETPSNLDHDDPRHISLLVPAPHINLVHPNKRGPQHPSPRLPMDYSMVAKPTEATQDQQKQWIERGGEIRKTLRWRQPGE